MNRPQNTTFAQQSSVATVVLSLCDLASAKLTVKRSNNIVRKTLPELRTSLAPFHLTIFAAVILPGISFRKIVGNPTTRGQVSDVRSIIRVQNNIIIEQIISIGLL